MTSQGLGVVLGYQCVEPGGNQYITITTTTAASVSYNTHYSDGKLGQDYGGVGVGTTDDHGRYVGTWAVSVRAPGDSATVYAGMSRGGQWSAAPGVTFTLATHC